VASTTSDNIAWVAGANGLIGGHLLQQLCADPSFSNVIAFVRAHPSKAFTHKKLSYFICDWQTLLSSPETFEAPTQKVNALFCALGSTKKKTPNPAEYHTIDVDYPAAFAQLGRSYGASYYGLVSSNGANARALSSYLKMKGKVEHTIQQQNYAHFAIARPSLLLGDRQETRLLESASEVVCKRLPGNLKAIHAHDVAAGLIHAYSNQKTGTEVLNSKSMQGAFNAG